MKLTTNSTLYCIVHAKLRPDVHGGSVFKQSLEQHTNAKLRPDMVALCLSNHLSNIPIVKAR